MAKPELLCPVSWTSGSALPVGRVDLSVVASGYTYSGFAIALGSLSAATIVFLRPLFIQGLASTGAGRLNRGE